MNIKACEVEIGMTVKTVYQNAFKVTSIDHLQDGSLIFGDDKEGFHYLDLNRMVEWID
jgi:hypothetical protein